MAHELHLSLAVITKPLSLQQAGTGMSVYETRQPRLPKSGTVEVLAGEMTQGIGVSVLHVAFYFYHNKT